ncbi:MAG: energy transducer TonB [Flavobacteriia bacterium]|nr:energy transducer TonB [Flavobacteriia bacterium]
MKSRKTEKANLELRRGLFRDIGLVLGLVVIYGLMSAKFYPEKVKGLAIEGGAIEEEVIPITKPDMPKPPPPPEAPPEVLEVVEDDIEIDEIELESTEVSEDTEIALIEEVAEASDEVFDFVRVEAYPVFPGCEGEPTNDEKYRCFETQVRSRIASEFEFPAIARQMGTGGKAYVNFIIERDGSISNVQIVRSSGDASIDQEAVRSVKAALPKMTPAKVGGRAVRMTYTVPINARIQ